MLEQTTTFRPVNTAWRPFAQPVNGSPAPVSLEDRVESSREPALNLMPRLRSHSVNLASNANELPAPTPTFASGNLEMQRLLNSIVRSQAVVPNSILTI